MKKLLSLPVLLTIFQTASQSASVTTADFTMWQEHSIAPRFTSPATPGWNNYIQNLRAGATSSGFVNTGSTSSPGYFRTLDVSEVTLSQMVTTDPGVSSPTSRHFKSWLGKVDPGSVFGSNYADEWGNSLHTPFLLVTSTAVIQQGGITVSSIGRNYTSVADPSYAAARSGIWNTWSEGRAGVTDLGDDNALGGTGPDADTYVTSGAMNAQPVFAIVGTGIGHAFNISTQYDGNPWDVGTLDEDIMDEYYDQWGNQTWDIQTTYTVNYTKGGPPISTPLSGDTIITVPEPGATLLSVLGALGLILRRRR